MIMRRADMYLDTFIMLIILCYLSHTYLTHENPTEILVPYLSDKIYIG